MQQKNEEAHRLTQRLAHQALGRARSQSSIALPHAALLAELSVDQLKRVALHRPELGLGLDDLGLGQHLGQAEHARRDPSCWPLDGDEVALVAA